MKKKKRLTIFTSTYNRAYCLHLCYESLLRQTSNDFVWLIIDDGSTDNTKKIVDGWIKDKKIDIIYHYQKNQGMHSGHNAAYRLMDTELNVCIDSDDFMTDDAVEKIISFWNENGSKKYAGIIALDITKTGQIIGTNLPNVKDLTLTDTYHKYKVKGDKKLIYRTDVIKKYPEYPIFKGEKYVGLAYKYILIDQDYSLLVMNEPVCVVEYLQDGSTNNMYKAYVNNPKGFAFYRKTRMQYAPSKFKKYVECALYVSSSIISKNKNFIKESPCKITTVFAIPVGYMMYVFIKHKYNMDVKINAKN